MWKMQESVLTENIPLICSSALWNLNFFVFTFWVSSGITIGSGCSLMTPRWQVLFPFWVPSGLTCLTLVVATIADDYDVLHLLIWQEIFHFSKLIYFLFEKDGACHLYHRCWYWADIQLKVEEVWMLKTTWSPLLMKQPSPQDDSKLIHVNVWQKPLQHCKVISLQLIKK